MSSSENGVTFWDVSRVIRDIEQTWRCNVAVTVAVPISERSGKALTIHVRAQQRGVGVETVWICGVSACWPWSEARTFSGALLKLLLQLDAKLEDAREDALPLRLPLTLE